MVVTILILVSIMITSSDSASDPVTIALNASEGLACVQSEPHWCLCEGDDIRQPLIIDGESVRVLEKEFSVDEIERLKTPYPSGTSTY